MYVEYESEDPFSFNFNTKMSRQAWCVSSYAPGVVGKSVLSVLPVIYAEPLSSTHIPNPISTPLPPMKVEYDRAEPFSFNLKANTSAPLEVTSYALVVVGNEASVVHPVAYTEPEASTSMSLKFPSPMYVEYTSEEPLSLSFDTNIPPSANDVLKAPGVDGKSDRLVHPERYTFPESSIAITGPPSVVLAPKKVEYTRPEPVELSFVTKNVKSSLCVLSYAPAAVGKFVLLVAPATTALPDGSTQIE